MFTGIVEEVGEVRRIVRKGDIHLFTVAADKTLEEMVVGDSVSVSGVCLTVVDLGKKDFSVEATPETMRTASLGELTPGHSVNLERSLRLGGKLGGHLVTGHIDGTGRIGEIRKEGESYVMAFRAAEQLMRYLVPKGSVALDGVSLTVVEVEGERFTVAVIPFTYRETTFSRKGVGSLINIECDIIGKYVERLLAGYVGKGNIRSEEAGKIDWEFLARHGFA